ncbi:type III-B CRISPR module RAMP protein Cmr6 [Maridesulfovibrio bastinii]|uniref:type III-B CRISPR module RAMP protein Cmr6 n=1 Tax=Maridesulfovibrio bastinii TaxID=47157 RepID=UPI000412E04D|nr:type III-B CRISPR module RAMP protein Cmr6 [Maridesulfovibrio bastinii]
MQFQALREKVVNCFDGDCQNLGLLISKLNLAVDNSNDNKHDYKDKALEQMEGFCLEDESAKAYKTAFQRLKSAVNKRKDCEIFEIKTSTRVFLGTGNASVFEFGFNLNYPWGVPYISGSTLKGAVSSYLARRGGDAWKRFDAATKSEAQVELFGGSIKGDKKSYSGLLTFHDAWMCPWSSRKDYGDWFDKEVITPHYPNYYNKKVAPTGMENAPTGMENPIPIHVAALCPGLRFQVVIQGPEKYRVFAKDVLVELLEVEGVGGKTAVGYGRFEYVKNAQERREEMRKNIQAVETKEALVELYKANKNVTEFVPLFAEKLREYKFDFEISDMWKSLYPLDYITIFIRHDKIKNFKDLNKRFSSLGSNISHWKERSGVTELCKCPEGQKLFDLMLEKWPEDVAAGADSKVVKALSYSWSDIACSFDDLLERIESGQNNWPPLKDLQQYIEGVFSGDELELLLCALEEKGF